MNQDHWRRSCEWIPARRDSGWRVMDDPTAVLMREWFAGWRALAEQAEVAL